MRVRVRVTADRALVGVGVRVRVRVTADRALVRVRVRVTADRALLRRRLRVTAGVRATTNLPNDSSGGQSPTTS